jgi:hypothetical protein
VLDGDGDGEEETRMAAGGDARPQHQAIHQDVGPRRSHEAGGATPAPLLQVVGHPTQGKHGGTAEGEAHQGRRGSMPPQLG